MISAHSSLGYTGEDAIEEYISMHIEPEPELLRRLYRETHIKMLNPRMASGHIQGRLLKSLVQMIRPTNILEIGTFTGYATLCMAEGLSNEGRVDTIEVDDEMESFIQKWFAASPYGDRIELHIGNALTIVPTLGKMFDLIFIDGEKREYPEYYQMAINHLNIGGYILADNTLWDGHVVDSEYENDQQTKAIKEFNRLVAEDERVTVSMVYIRDGLTIIRRNF